MDENPSRHLKAPLCARGYDVTTAAEEGLLARPDPEGAAAAAAEGRVRFTLDLEFGDLRKYPPGKHPGIVLFRPRHFGPLAVNEFVQEFVRSGALAPLAQCVVIVEPGRVRVRRPPLDPSGSEWKEIPH